MQFLVIAYDGTDKDALKRRLAMREKHIALGDELIKNGQMWFGAALRDDNDEMIGSMLLMNFKNREELQKWLDVEPYVTGNVWDKIEIKRCSVRNPWQFSQTKEYYKKATKEE